MDNLAFTLGRNRFNYRVAGLCVDDGYALLHRAESDDFWTLPGGRCQFGEPSHLAIARELREEIGVAVTTRRLLWFVENFFGNAVQRVHELTCYYLYEFPAGSPLRRKDRDHVGLEGEDLRLIFRWFSFSELPTADLYPTFLRTEIANLPAVPTHLIHYDPDD